jgi:hypothetical protein
MTSCANTTKLSREAVVVCAESALEECRDAAVAVPGTSSKKLAAENAVIAGECKVKHQQVKACYLRTQASGKRSK